MKPIHERRDGRGRRQPQAEPTSSSDGSASTPRNGSTRGCSTSAGASRRYVILDFGNRGILGMQIPEEFGGLALRTSRFHAGDGAALRHRPEPRVDRVHPQRQRHPPDRRLCHAGRCAQELLPLLARGRELSAFCPDRAGRRLESPRHRDRRRARRPGGLAVARGQAVERLRLGGRGQRLRPARPTRAAGSDM